MREHSNDSKCKHRSDWQPHQAAHWHGFECTDSVFYHFIRSFQTDAETHWNWEPQRGEKTNQLFCHYTKVDTNLIYLLIHISIVDCVFLCLGCDAVLQRVGTCAPNIAEVSILVCAIISLHLLLLSDLALAFIPMNKIVSHMVCVWMCMCEYQAINGITRLFSLGFSPLNYSNYLFREICNCVRFFRRGLASFNMICMFYLFHVFISDSLIGKRRRRHIHRCRFFIGKTNQFRSTTFWHANWALFAIDFGLFLLLSWIIIIITTLDYIMCLKRFFSVGFDDGK